MWTVILVSHQSVLRRLYNHQYPHFVRVLRITIWSCAGAVYCNGCAVYGTVVPFYVTVVPFYVTSVKFEVTSVKFEVTVVLFM
jgi:hypothetical protein